MASTTSLETALKLKRVAALEERLALVELALKASTGRGIDHLLASYRSATSPPSPPATIATETAAEPFAEPVAEPAASPTPPEPIDIQPFILKALSLRKGVQNGTVEDGEVAFGSLVGDSGLSPAQIEQVRQWAGL